MWNEPWGSLCFDPGLTGGQAPGKVLVIKLTPALSPIKQGLGAAGQHSRQVG